MPFLENVTRGRGIPRERLEEVGEHYFLFGGRSPINDQNRALLAAIREDLAGSGHRPPGLLGQPQLGPLPRRHPARRCATTASGARRSLTTSAYSSYSCCRQYRENLADAVAAGRGRAAAGPAAAVLQPPGLRGAGGRRHPGGAGRPPRRGPRRAPSWSSSPTPSPRRWPRPAGRRRGRRRLRAPAPRRRRGGHRAGCGRRPAAATRTTSSTAPAPAPPHVPWLEPDVNDHLAALAERGVAAPW